MITSCNESSFQEKELSTILRFLSRCKCRFGVTYVRDEAGSSSPPLLPPPFPPRLVGEIFTALGRLRDDGLTLVAVEQNARAAFAVADSVYVMDRGRVVLHGDAATLATDPRVTAAFLGGGFSGDVPGEGTAPDPAEPVER